MVNILFCGNAGVFDGMLTCALSILKRTESKEPFHFFVFTMDLSDLKETYVPLNPRQAETFRRVIVRFNPENRRTVIDVGDLYRRHFSGCPNEGAYCSPYTLIRLFADLVPGIPDKLLYLDADVMFNRDVHLLYDTDVSAVEYAACPDHYGKYLIHPRYINAGVLLFNM
jgi:lipopolysaccharide biosynthesis glycosyltransferase